MRSLWKALNPCWWLRRRKDLATRRVRGAPSSELILSPSPSPTLHSPACGASCPNLSRPPHLRLPLHSSQLTVGWRLSCPGSTHCAGERRQNPVRSARARLRTVLDALHQRDDGSSGASGAVVAGCLHAAACVEKMEPEIRWQTSETPRPFWRLSSLLLQKITRGRWRRRMS